MKLRTHTHVGSALLNQISPMVLLNLVMYTSVRLNQWGQSLYRHTLLVITEREDENSKIVLHPLIMVIGHNT